MTLTAAQLPVSLAWYDMAFDVIALQVFAKLLTTKFACTVMQKYLWWTRPVNPMFVDEDCKFWWCWSVFTWKCNLIVGAHVDHVVKIEMMIVLVGPCHGIDCNDLIELSRFRQVTRSSQTGSLALKARRAVHILDSLKQLPWAIVDLAGHFLRLLHQGDQGYWCIRKSCCLSSEVNFRKLGPCLCFTADGSGHGLSAGNWSCCLWAGLSGTDASKRNLFVSGSGYQGCHHAF